MWNIENKMNKQHKNRLIDAKKRLVVARKKGIDELGEKGIKKY